MDRNLMKIVIASLTAFTLFSGASEAVIEKAVKQDSFSQLTASRYSGYSFDSSKPVTQSQLRAIVEAARSAPSSYNDQPWNFIICDRTTNPKAYEKALSTLVEFNQGWAKSAPVLVISVASTIAPARNEANRWGQYDTGAAAFSMMLEATSLGLMAHQMGGFDEAKVRKEFSIPNNFIPMSVMAIGYPSADETKPERKRRPVAENFFIGNWGTSFE